MLIQLAIGTLTITLSVLIAAGFAGLSGYALQRNARWLVRKPHQIRFVVALMLIVLWVQVALSLCIWLWAVVFMAVGVFETLEPAVYFAFETFTTLGFGDLLLPVEWRLLSGMAASNGLLMFGFFTAYLVEMMRRLRREQTSGRVERD